MESEQPKVELFGNWEEPPSVELSERAKRLMGWMDGDDFEVSCPEGPSAQLSKDIRTEYQAQALYREVQNAQFNTMARQLESLAAALVGKLDQPGDGYDDGYTAGRYRALCELQQMMADMVNAPTRAVSG